MGRRRRTGRPQLPRPGGSLVRGNTSEERRGTPDQRSLCVDSLDSGSSWSSASGSPACRSCVVPWDRRHPRPPRRSGGLSPRRGCRPGTVLNQGPTQSVAPVLRGEPGPVRPGWETRDETATSYSSPSSEAPYTRVPGRVRQIGRPTGNTCPVRRTFHHRPHHRAEGHWETDSLADDGSRRSRSVGGPDVTGGVSRET